MCGWGNDYRRRDITGSSSADHNACNHTVGQFGRGGGTRAWAFAINKGDHGNGGIIVPPTRQVDTLNLALSRHGGDRFGGVSIIEFHKRIDIARARIGQGDACQFFRGRVKIGEGGGPVPFGDEGRGAKASAHVVQLNRINGGIHISRATSHPLEFQTMVSDGKLDGFRVPFDPSGRILFAGIDSTHLNPIQINIDGIRGESTPADDLATKAVFPCRGDRKGLADCPGPLNEGGLSTIWGGGNIPWATIAGDARIAGKSPAGISDVVGIPSFG